MQIDLSIVIPVYRSAGILTNLVKRIERTLGGTYGAALEVILVNDCSPDTSWEVIQGLCLSRPWLKGINLRKNTGQHNAIMVGLRHASGRHIVMMDDDLQHSPDDIPSLVAQLENGLDVCYASFRSKQHALWKRLGSRFNDLVACQLLGKPKGLYLSPFKAMISEIRDEVVLFTGPHAYLDGLILSATSRIGSIVIEHHARPDGQSGYGLRKSVSLWLKMATSFSIAPLRMASLLGLLFSGSGFVAAIAFVIQRFTINAMPVGWSSLIVSILIFGGIQLLALGIVGEYVGRILLYVNGRPQAVIESTRNLPPTV